MGDKKIITLNLRGKKFQTKVSTLTSDVATNTLFPTLVSFLSEKETCIFLDRDPTYFHYILNYFCNGEEKWVGPSDRDSILSLKVEGEYYLMPKSFFNKLQYKNMLTCEFKEKKKFEFFSSGIFDVLSLNPNNFISWSFTGPHYILNKYDFSYYDMFLTHIGLCFSIDSTVSQKYDNFTTELTCSNGFKSTKYSQQTSFGGSNLIFLCFKIGEVIVQPIRQIKICSLGINTKIQNIELYGTVYERFLPWKRNEHLENENNETQSK